MSDDTSRGVTRNDHIIDLRTGGDALEAIMRSVEQDIHQHGWGHRPHLLWIRLAGQRHLEVFEPPLSQVMFARGDDPADTIGGLAAAMPALDPTVLGIILTVEANALPHGGGEDIAVRQVFGLSIASQREVYLVRPDGGEPQRWEPPDGDTILLALRRLTHRAATMRDPNPMRVPEEWS